MRSLLSKFIQIGTRVWWARVLYKVPEPTKLGYQSGYFEKKLMNQPSFQFIYPDWYPSLVGSGTNLAILKIGRLVLWGSTDISCHGFIHKYC